GGAAGGSMGGQDMEGVSTGGGAGGAGTAGQDCNDGGISGGGIGGGMGCDNGDSGGGAGGVGQFPGDGDAEKAEQLGEELDKSLGDFDESLGQEQREISSASRNTEGFDTGTGGNRGGSISLGEQAAGAMSSAGGSSGGGSGAGGDGAGEVGGGPLDGLDAQEIAKRTPDDIEVLIDDDIVAKQLREAALAEEDPELRERLWEEYRKYKGM
ncbi:MAG: hypothetical protein OEZ11_13205, partial [Gammaproteobacteria bacterium]|nr:hypothetical protein [Gammaproteobacteria bacterium]